MANVRLETVRKVFEADDKKGKQLVVALDDVSLLVRHGETLAVLGPSGSGKSSLLRVMAGLTPYQGHVYYDDQLMDGVKPAERNIGMVFQSYALYPHLDGYDNLGFTFRVRQRTPQEADERIRITSEVMGIGFEELLRHKPGYLSGGEQQRVALGRALVREPDLFLLDEPLANLDARLRARTRAEVKRLLDRLGHTAVYVTHDQLEAIAVGDRLAIMNAGRIEQVGAYRVLYDTPINAFVAGFLGQPPMNLLPGELNQGGAWQAGDLIIPVPDVVSQRMRPGWGLTLGIRPENARLTADDPPTLSGRVAHIERDLPRGIQTLLLEHPRLPQLSVIVPSKERVLPGDRVPVALPVEHLVFFDGKTGQRLS